MPISIKHLFSILFFTTLLSITHAQLPEVTTTDQQSMLDINNGIDNEAWFLTKNGEYQCRFRNTSTGVNHAFIKLAALMIKANGKVSDFDYANFKKLPKAEDGIFDFETMVKKTQYKDPEFYINRRYALLSGPVKAIEMNNLEGRTIPYWTIRTIRGK